ncbi:MAG: hypothetical protein B6U76_03265 [Desulfurococcales archaeon ex4484_217_2]|nr:MAG: hypothetical protein B6U76_03265 [Desulfurococcales archaeon ex4484_217_2]
MSIPRLKEMRKEKIPLTAFYDEDMEAIAKKLKLYDDIRFGKMKCFICGAKVTFENLGAFLKTGDGVKVVCDNSECIFKAIRIAEELKSK